MKIQRIRHGLYLGAIALLVAIAGCTSTKSITSLNNGMYFKEPPKIVRSEDRYFLRFVYGDTEGAWGFFMMTHSKIKNDSLIFYLPVTTSSGNLRGRTQFEEIKTEEKIELISQKKVYWKEPEGNFVPMTVEIVSNEELSMSDKFIKGQTH